MYAIVKDGSRQFRVAKGDEVEFDYKGDLGAGKAVEFTDVLLVSDGEKVTVGTPVVEGARVTGEVVSDAHGPKLSVYKYKRRKNAQTRKGHKQDYTLVRITDIQTA